MSALVAEESVTFDIRPQLERRIELFLKQTDKEVAKALADFLLLVNSTETLQQITDLIELGAINELIDLIGRYTQPIAIRLVDLMRLAGQFEMGNLNQIAADSLERRQTLSSAPRGPGRTLPAGGPPAPGGAPSQPSTSPVAGATGPGGVAPPRIPPAVLEALGQRPKPQIAVTFDPSDADGVAAMQRLRDEFMKYFNDDLRAVVSEVVTDGLNRGLSIPDMARAIRDHIGLNKPQARNLKSYEQQLRDLSPDALRAATRDRRYDAMVRKAIESGRPLTEEQIRKLVDARRKKMIQLRANTIAYNESSKAMNFGRYEALRQYIERTGADPDEVISEWRSLRDGRVRDTHVAMDGQTARFNADFVSPSGARLKFPHDPNGPAHEVINCRCYLITSFQRRTWR